MFVVGREILMLDFLPLRPIDDREERIGIGKLGMDAGDIHFVRPAQCLAINQGAADNKYFLFFLADIQSILHRFTRETIHEVGLGQGRQHDIFAVRQRAIGQRLEGFAAHEDGVSRSQLLEAFHIVGQMPEQLQVLTDSIIVGYRGDDRYSTHIIN